MKKAKKLMGLLLIILALSVFSAPAFADTVDGGDGSGGTQGTTTKSTTTPPPNLSWIELIIWYATHPSTVL